MTTAQTTTESGFDEGAFVPPVEPGQQAQPTDLRDREAPQSVAQDAARFARAQAPALPIYLSQKFFWHESKFPGGQPYLSPLPEYLAQLSEDSVKFSLLWADQFDQKLINAELKDHRSILERRRARNEWEETAYYRYVYNQLMRNSYNAAVAQWESDRYADTELLAGRDPDLESRKTAKDSARDVFTEAACEWRIFALDLIPVPHPKFTVNDDQIAFEARGFAYDAARIEASKLRKPTPAKESTKLSQDAYRLTNRPSAKRPG